MTIFEPRLSSPDLELQIAVTQTVVGALPPALLADMVVTLSRKDHFIEVRVLLSVIDEEWIFLYPSASTPGIDAWDSTLTTPTFTRPNHPFFLSLDLDISLQMFKSLLLRKDETLLGSTLTWLSSGRSVEEFTALAAHAENVEDSELDEFEWESAITASPSSKQADDPGASGAVQGSSTSLGAAVITLLFASNRAKNVQEESPDCHFTSRRGPLSYGACDVSIPRSHSMGTLERPRLWKRELKERPEKHICLRGVEDYTRSHFLARIAERSDTKDAAFIFVHGYNVTFSEAARRTAQLWYDLGFEGTGMFFSWPSLGHPLAYPPDEATAEASEEPLFQFLKEVLSYGAYDRLHLIGHSLGNRIVASALRRLQLTTPGALDRVSQVILAAPDIDADVLRGLSGVLRQAARRITLYGSSSDLALRASRLFHRAPRAGDGRTNLVITDGIDSIDASALDCSFLRHIYVGENSTVLSDIFSLFRYGSPPSDRFGLRPRGDGGWEFVPQTW